MPPCTQTSFTPKIVRPECVMQHMYLVVAIPPVTLYVKGNWWLRRLQKTRVAQCTRPELCLYMHNTQPQKEIYVLLSDERKNQNGIHVLDVIPLLLNHTGIIFKSDVQTT